MRAIQKDTFREIRRTLGRFFSIFLICGIGAAFFSGIRAILNDINLETDDGRYKVAGVDTLLVCSNEKH